MFNIRPFLFICFIFFCLNLSASEQKDRILDNFFATVKEMQAQDIPVIKNMEADITSEIRFSNHTLKILQPFINNIFRTTLPSVLKSSGLLKIGFKNADGKIEPDNIYLYTNSAIGSFTVVKSGDNIDIYVPQLGFIISDTIDTIREVLLKQNKISVKKPLFPADFATSFFDYVAANEKSIREKMRMENKTGLAKGQKTYFLNYPLDKGSLNIEIYDRFWTFASVTFNGNKNKTRMRLQYPMPIEKVEPGLYFPEFIRLSGEKDDNIIYLELSGLKYNTPVTEKSFSLQSIGFREFLTVITLKILQED
jgi:hypothetical protein